MKLFLTHQIQCSRVTRLMLKQNKLECYSFY